MIHEFKTDPEVFEAARAGLKPWEIRNLSDRTVRVGDTIVLRETEYTGEAMAADAEEFPLVYTGRELQGVVTYILEGPIYGLKADWSILTVNYFKVERV